MKIQLNPGVATLLQNDELEPLQAFAGTFLRKKTKGHENNKVKETGNKKGKFKI